MNRLASIALLAAAVLAAAPASATDAADDAGLGSVLILSEGRIKPVDTFARAQLLTLYERSALKDRSAVEWVTALLVEPAKAIDVHLVRVRNAEVVNALGIEPRATMLYSMREVGEAIDKASQTIYQLDQKNRNERSLVENQLVELATKLRLAFDLSLELRAFVPDVKVDVPEVAKALGVAEGASVSYARFMTSREAMDALRAAIGEPGTEGAPQPSPEAIAIAQALRQKQSEQSRFGLLSIVPPEEHPMEARWLSPWELLDGRKLPEFQEKALAALDRGVAGLVAGEAAQAAAHFGEYRRLVDQRLDASVPGKVRAELAYNRFDFFGKSLAIYVVAFLLVALSWMLKPVWMRRAAFWALVAGLAVHAVGLGMRVYIMGRAPVSNLYESIVFAGFCAVAACLWLEARRRNGLGLLSAAVTGSVLHFLALRYATDGDTMGMLAAVLDSNFWLTTHVVTIMIGYGCAFVAGLLGHVYLVQQIARPKAADRLRDVLSSMHGVALLALFFTTLGTILGGIWADQSWGRFWGWDPKENGALLIVLWVLWLVHGRVSDKFGAVGYATGMVLLNAVVAIAWFGVNLLNVGLHSYGFTDSVATNLALFCGIEALFCAITYPLAKTRAAAQRAEREAALATARADAVAVAPAAPAIAAAESSGTHAG